MEHSGVDAVHKKSNLMETHWSNWLKILVLALAYFKVLLRTRYEQMLYMFLSNAPLHVHNFLSILYPNIIRLLVGVLGLHVHSIT